MFPVLNKELHIAHIFREATKARAEHDFEDGTQFL